MDKSTASLEVLDNLIDNIPYSIFWKDQNLRFIGCNKLFAAQFGFTSSNDIIGKTDYDFPWSDSLREKYRADDCHILMTQSAKLNFEELQEQADGSIRTLLISKVPIIQDGTAVGVLGIYTDITERKRLERALIEAKDAAEVASRAKLEFIRNMEHDIRTPFAGIWGIAQHLWEQEQDLNKKELLGDIVGSAKELLDYCNEIVDFSKIESGFSPLVKTPVNIKHILERVKLIEKNAAKHKSLNLIFTISPNLPEFVLTDGSRLYRILINLVSNAIKFTTQGAVYVDTRCVKIDPEHVQVCIKITDTGIGISPDQLNIIYDMFSKLSPSNKGLYKGLGLGLPITKQFIEELDGKLEVHSTLGVGTVFSCEFTFPTSA